MNTLIKRLPLLGFVLAAVFAFAFAEPVDSSTVRFVPILDGSGQIVGGTPVEPGYTCNNVPAQICTALFENDDPKQENLIPGSVQNGVYQPPM